jgi:hypothetical protein
MSSQVPHSTTGVRAAVAIEADLLVRLFLMLPQGFWVSILRMAIRHGAEVAFMCVMHVVSVER